MAGWHHQLNGHEFEQTQRHGRHNGYEFELTQGDDEGPGSRACCSPWGRKELDMTEQLK